NRRRRMDEEQQPLVLVTGATGFVGTHCVRELLEQNYRVRGTVRDKKAFRKITPLLRLPKGRENLELYEIDLHDSKERWIEALDGVTFVLHVASPVPVEPTEDTIKTALAGTMAVMEAAAVVHSVRKVVMTSSCTAVNDGHSNRNRVFDETVWTKMSNPAVDCYARSKTLAEKAAWKFYESERPNPFELTVFNPTLIIGPLISDADSGSAMIVGRMLSFTTFLAAPPAYIGIVDVRDVASAHVKALITPSTNGERILLTNAPTIRFRQLTKWLQIEFGPHGYPVSFVEAPLWLIKFYTKLSGDKQAKAAIARCDGPLCFDNDKSIRLLDMNYRDPRESLYTQVYSMLELGMIKKTRKMQAKEKRKVKIISDASITV
ncbi:hypothetical protein PMAYCL1PPCAC_17381, partial [Pristionchus mayeri]